MAQAKTPTVCKPKFEANRTKPIGKPTRKEFGSPAITDAALDRRRLSSSAPDAARRRIISAGGGSSCRKPSIGDASGRGSARERRYAH
jgi:hypothetical protein